jgi:hypothetical protein
VPRRLAWAMLVATALMLTGGVVFVVAAAAPPLRLIAVVAVVTMAGGLVAGAQWLITVACAMTVVEIALAFAAGSISSGWIGALAVGVFLVVESSVATLEVAGNAIAPREPAGHRVLVITSTAGVVWLVASILALIAGGTDLPGTFTRIAGVAAAAAVLATLARLVERRRV